jgi:hypothetical protein
MMFNIIFFISTFMVALCHSKALFAHEVSRMTTLATQNYATCTSPLSCPASDQCIFTSSNSTIYLVECQVDHYGGDLGITQTDTVESCLEQCTKTPQCIAVSFDVYNCYMKSTILPPYTATNIVGAVTATSTSASAALPSSVSSDTICPANFSCPANNGCFVSGNVTGSTYVLQCDTTYHGNDLTVEWYPTLEECFSSCDTNSPCSAITYVESNNGGNGACYIKSYIDWKPTYSKGTDAMFVIKVNTIPTATPPASSS